MILSYLYAIIFQFVLEFVFKFVSIFVFDPKLSKPGQSQRSEFRLQRRQRSRGNIYRGDSSLDPARSFFLFDAAHILNFNQTLNYRHRHHELEFIRLTGEQYTNYMFNPTNSQGSHHNNKNVSIRALPELPPPIRATSYMRKRTFVAETAILAKKNWRKIWP